MSYFDSFSISGFRGVLEITNNTRDGGKINVTKMKKKGK